MLLSRRGISRAKMEEAIVAGDTEIDAHIRALAAAAFPLYIDTVPRNTALSTAAWGTANRAVLMKTRAKRPDLVLSHASVLIGALGTSPNMDTGLYALDGTRLTSHGGGPPGGTAERTQAYSAAYEPEFGEEFYIALACSATDTSFHRASSSNAASTLRDHIAIIVESAYPLPATLDLSGALVGSLIIPSVRVGVI